LTWIETTRRWFPLILKKKQLNKLAMHLPNSTLKYYVCPNLLQELRILFVGTWLKLHIFLIWWHNYSPFGELNQPTCSDQGCICNNEGGWENQKFSLERLRYLDITGVQGLDYEKRLVQMILEGAPAIKKSKLPPPLEMGLILDIPSC
jgi:hypothetical protein